MGKIILGEADKEGDGIIISTEPVELEYDVNGIPRAPPEVKKGIRLSAKNIQLISVKPITRMQHLKAVFRMRYDGILKIGEDGFSFNCKIDRIDDTQDGYIRVSNYRKEEQA